YLQTRCKVIELTTQRLKITSGVFTKVTETLELYRVKDIETRQPFFSRMVGVENVQMTTTDASSPLVLIEAVPSSVGFADKLRNQVEAIRQQKRVPEIDIEYKHVDFSLSIGAIALTVLTEGSALETWCDFLVFASLNGRLRSYGEVAMVEYEIGGD